MGSVFRGCQVACIGFTFTKDSPLNQIGQLEQSIRARLESLPSLPPPAPSVVPPTENGQAATPATASAMEKSTSPQSNEDRECSNCSNLTVRFVCLISHVLVVVEKTVLVRQNYLKISKPSKTIEGNLPSAVPKPFLKCSERWLNVTGSGHLFHDSTTRTVNVS